MKKSVFVLLVLLAVLIVTCVYQKTYTIYSTSPKKLTLVERETTTQSQSIAKPVAAEKKEEKTSTLPIVSVPTPTKPVEVKPEPETKSVSEHKPAVKADKIVEEKSTTTTKSIKELIPFYQKMVEKEAKEKAALSTKNSISEPKVPATQTEEASASKPVAIEEPKVESIDKTKPVAQKSGEKEIVDYLMWALKNRDIALKNRDEVEARIQELITKALKDRQIVLDERSKNEVALKKLQTELIDARDASYESVINPKTTNQGEK